jgi:hypothetical protein
VVTYTKSKSGHFEKCLRWFETKIWTKNKSFLYNVRNFFQKFLRICRIRKVSFELKIFLESNNAKFMLLQKLPGLLNITLMVYWEEYIHQVKSFSSRAHIRLFQNALTSLIIIIFTYKNYHPRRTIFSNYNNHLVNWNELVKVRGRIELKEN